MGCDMQVSRGTLLRPWWVLTSRHKGTLPASASSEATATVGGAGKGRALSLGPGGPDPFVLPLGRGQSHCHRPTMLRTLVPALLALVTAVGPSQASGFTGEGSGLCAGMAEG